MKQIKNQFKSWGTARILRLVLGGALGISYYYNRENLFLFAGIMLLSQAIFNITCPGGSCATNYKSAEKQPIEIKKYEQKN